MRTSDTRFWTRGSALLAALLSLAMAPAKDGCEPNTYVPSPSRTPLYDGAGEVHINGYGGSNGYGGEVNYAVAENAGIGAAYWYKNEKNDSTGLVERHQAVELAGTWFSRPSDIVRLEVGGGLGIGSGGGTLDSAGNIRVVDGDYLRPYLQGAIGVVPIGGNGGALRFEAAGILRFSYVGFTSFTRAGVEVDPAPSALFVEPGIMLRFGIPSVMLDLAISRAFAAGEEPDFNFNNGVMTIGAHVVLGRSENQRGSR